MKIAYITHYLPSYRHGILNILSEISSYDITVYSNTSPQQGLDLNHNVNNKFKIIHSSYISFNLVDRKIFFQSRLPLLILQNKYDVYIVSALKSDLSVWLGLLLGKILNRKIVLWGHCRKKDKFFHDYIMKMMFKLSSAIIFYSEDFKAKWNFKAKNYEKSFVAPNTIEVLVTKNISIKYPFPTQYTTAIYSGRLIKSKRLDFLIEALNYLKNDNVFFNMIIIGDGPEKKSLQKKCEEFGLTNYVRFLSSIFDNNLLNAYYNISDISILPSSAGLSINQSFAFGKAVITDDDFSKHGPEIALVKDNLTGIFYKKNNLLDFTSKLIQLDIDKGQLVKMGAAALSCYENHYSPKHMSSGILNAINYVV